MSKGISLPNFAVLILPTIKSKQMKLPLTINRFTISKKMGLKLILGLILNGMTLNAISQTDTLKEQLSPPDFNDHTEDALNAKRKNTMNIEENRSIVDKMQRNKNENTADSHSTLSSQGVNSPDGVEMKDGKVLFTNMGQIKEIKEKLIMNGITVMRNGEVILRNGKKFTLKEGERIDMSGQKIQ